MSKEATSTKQAGSLDKDVTFHIELSGIKPRPRHHLLWLRQFPHTTTYYDACFALFSSVPRKASSKRDSYPNLRHLRPILQHFYPIIQQFVPVSLE